MRLLRAAAIGLRDEARLFRSALQFFTRLPILAWVGYQPTDVHRSPRYFPAVGAVVGGIVSLIALVAMRWWSVQVSMALVLIASLLLTGAFHEDGFADVADGFGGGFTPERVLAIMKDSRVGAYALVAITAAFLLRWALWVDLAQRGPEALIAGLVGSHTVSRWYLLSLVRTLPYVRDDAFGKAKPVAQGISTAQCILAGWPLLPAGLVYMAGPAWAQLLPWSAVLAALLVCLLVPIVMGAWFKARIGGYTGDCLGATQFVGELVFLLAITASLST